MKKSMVVGFVLAMILGVSCKDAKKEALLAEVAKLEAEHKAVSDEHHSQLHAGHDALKADHEFLTRGGVFSKDWIDSFISLKMEEVNKVRMTTHPVEFEMYYSC